MGNIPQNVRRDDYDRKTEKKYKNLLKIMVFLIAVIVLGFVLYVSNNSVHALLNSLYNIIGGLGMASVLSITLLVLGAFFIYFSRNKEKGLGFSRFSHIAKNTILYISLVGGQLYVLGYLLNFLSLDLGLNFSDFTIGVISFSIMVLVTLGLMLSHVFSDDEIVKTASDPIVVHHVRASPMSFRELVMPDIPSLRADPEEMSPEDSEEVSASSQFIGVPVSPV